MFQCKLFFTLLLTLITIIKICPALPSKKFPIAYNLHQDLLPSDVNDLGKENQRLQAVLDVQTTINEVHKLLETDPTLPRLTKGEIKDLFQKVTKDELDKSIQTGDKVKEGEMRALIQALPYHLDEIESIENLARIKATTKAPTIEPEIPDDLKKLLKNYGLLDKEEKIGLAQLPVIINTEHPDSFLAKDFEPSNNDEGLTLEEIQEQVRKSSLVNAKDYATFKPIGAGDVNVSSDMESFLKQFGLVDDGDSRKRKSIKRTRAPSVSVASKPPALDSSYFSPNFASLLDNIGIQTTKDKSSKRTNTKTRSSGIKNDPKATAEDYKKLEELLDTIRQLEKLNVSLTEKEVEKLNLRNFNLSDSLLAEGPDPIKHQVHYSALKNEIKRQEPSSPTKVSLALNGDLLESSLEATDDQKSAVTSSSISTTTTEATTSTTEEPTSTTEQERKNSLEDEIEPIEDPEPLPPPRRSGFYMLLDWNSFLEVGEDPDKIKIRFDPQIGDPSRFLTVNVP